MASNVQDLKGYDHQFLEQAPENLSCLICLCVARDPQQINCCGKLLCKGCLKEHQKRSNNCPCCREPITSFTDKRSQIEILSLKALCDNSANGCKWVGELRHIDKHSASCGFTLLPCPNKCYEGGKVVQLLRKDIEKHTKDECPRRQYKCPRCHEAGEYKERTTTHIEECPMVEVPCPRCKCQVRLARRNLPDHRLECMFEKVPCKYATIGCKEEVLRKDLGEHEGDSQTHLQIAIDTVHQLQITQENMQARSRELPFTYKFTNYEYHKTTGTRLYSPAFYTSRKGYKMCLSLDANGLGEGAGTHVTVGAYLMKGENDDHLPWPFTGEVTVELLNQLVDKNHYSMIILFDLNVDEKVSKRVVNNERASTGWGQARYIPHSELGRNAIRNCQYLKDDCLYFRVSVDAKGPSKPWLI